MQKVHLLLSEDVGSETHARYRFWNQRRSEGSIYLESQVARNNRLVYAKATQNQEKVAPTPQQARCS